MLSLFPSFKIWMFASSTFLAVSSLLLSVFYTSCCSLSCCHCHCGCCCCFRYKYCHWHSHWFNALISMLLLCCYFSGFSSSSNIHWLLTDNHWSSSISGWYMCLLCHGSPPSCGGRFVGCGKAAAFQWTPCWMKPQQCYAHARKAIIDGHCLVVEPPLSTWKIRSMVQLSIKKIPHPCYHQYSQQLQGTALLRAYYQLVEIYVKIRHLRLASSIYSLGWWLPAAGQWSPLLMSEATFHPPNLSRPQWWSGTLLGGDRDWSWSWRG